MRNTSLFGDCRIVTTRCIDTQRPKSKQWKSSEWAFTEFSRLSNRPKLSFISMTCCRRFGPDVIGGKGEEREEKLREEFK
jgi:hypothetical protein